MSDTTAPQIPEAEGKKLLVEVAAHPRRALIEAIAEASAETFEEYGAGLWWHLNHALGLVDAMPGLRIVLPARLLAAQAGAVQEALGVAGFDATPDDTETSWSEAAPDLRHTNYDILDRLLAAGWRRDGDRTLPLPTAREIAGNVNENAHAQGLNLLEHGISIPEVERVRDAILRMREPRHGVILEDGSESAAGHETGDQA